MNIRPRFQRLFALLCFAAMLALPAGSARAATPTFSSFDPLQFYTNSNPTIIHVSTNAFPSVGVTNLWVTNLFVSGFQVIIGSGAPSVTPASTNAIYLDKVLSQLWVWDPATAVWIAVNPSASSGQYTVPTVSDLRLIHDNGYLQWAATRGNLVATDGQGRNYWWDPSASDVDDGISVIDLSEHLSGEDGRWLEQ